MSRLTLKAPKKQPNRIPPRGPWKKGESGNPGGRKAVPYEVKQALAALLPKSVEVLGKLLNSKSENMRMLAVQTILDRNLGKVFTPITGKDGEALLPPQDHRATVQVLIAAALAKAIEGPNDPGHSA